MAARRLTPNLFGVSFGLAGLAQCWAFAAAGHVAPQWIADALWILTAAVWLVILVAYLRDVSAGGQLRTELDDVTFGPFVILATIVPMFLGVVLAHWFRSAGVTVFFVAAVGTVLIGGWLTGGWILNPAPLRQWHPGYFLPTAAGGLITASGLAQLGYPDLARAMFGYGVVCWLVLGSILLLRLFTEASLPLPLRPTIAIELAPPVVAGLAWFAINGGRADAFVLGLTGYGVLMALVQLRLIPAYRPVPFSVGWWSFAFSYAAGFALAIRWLAVAGLAARTVVALARGQFLPGPPPPQ